MNVLKKIMAAFAVAVAVVGLSLTVAQPAQAGVIACDWNNISWQTGGSTWGQDKFCGGDVAFIIQVDDRQTDGLCVHAEWRSGSGWHYVGHSESCGAVVTSNYTTGLFDEVRLVRGGSSCVGGGSCNGVGTNFFTVRSF